jgi:carbon storage regulator
MLVIRRRLGEILLIDGNIEIEILDLAPSHVKLGIRAPRSVNVLRKELQVTADENRAAAELSMESITGLIHSIPKITTIFPSKAPGTDR